MKIFSMGNMRLPGSMYQVRCYSTDSGCTIMVGHEGNEKVKRWHLSISHQDRLPNWDEIKQARYDLLNRSMDFAMILPRDGDYINLHNFCMHIWEIKEGEMIEAIDRL